MSKDFDAQEEFQQRRLGKSVEKLIEDDEDFEEVTGPDFIPISQGKFIVPEDDPLYIGDEENNGAYVGGDGCQDEESEGDDEGEDEYEDEPEDEDQWDEEGECIADGDYDSDQDTEDFYDQPGHEPISEEEREEVRQLIHRDFRQGRLIHRHINLTKIVFIVLFVSIIVFLGYFYMCRADEYLASPYNTKRQSVYNDRYIRGDIVSSDGELLVTTRVDDEGNETRDYIYGARYAHAIGYSTRGNTGLEALANGYLLSSHINPITKALNELYGEKTKGDTVVTTLNNKLQEAANQAIDGYKGAVIAMEVKTGKILVMLSRPNYNPNKINEVWDELVSDDSNSNLVNRATQGLYPPGSTFKVLTLLEYMRENPDSYGDFSFDCDSVFEEGEYTINCSKGVAHGEMSLQRAFALSCNGAFAKIGEDLDMDSLYALCEEVGFNEELPIDIESNASKFEAVEEDDTFMKMQTAIGQGKTLITPLQNLLITAAVANGGTVMEPMLISEIQTSEGSTVKTFTSSSYKKIMSSSEAEIIAQYMRSVVTDGTGSAAQGGDYTVAGKTGSAEWKSGENTHAWFVGFAPYDDPEIAVCVIVENAGSGGSVAAPIAAEVFSAYFDD